MARYRIVLEYGVERSVPLDALPDREAARSWAAFIVGGYMAGGLTGGLVVANMELQENGDWRLNLDGHDEPAWVRIEERTDDER